MKIEANILDDLMRAAYEGHYHECEHLIKQGADINAVNNLGNSALAFAVRRHHFKIAVLLINSGADLHQRNGEGQTLLTFELEACDPIATRFLMEHHVSGTMRNSVTGATPLMLAVKNNWKEVINYCLDSGASFKEIDMNGWNIFHYLALSSGWSHSLETLTEWAKHVEVEGKNNQGQTPLMTALIHRAPPWIITWLMDRITRVNLSDHEKRTALSYAVKTKNTYAIQSLILRGAFRFIEDIEGRSPTIEAQEWGNTNVLNLFRDSWLDGAYQLVLSKSFKKLE